MFQVKYLEWQCSLLIKIFLIKLYKYIVCSRMTSNQSSHEALSDPLPRLYSCFCDKIFTTYPGIYLHLKSKHSNLFQKYKKLKITKLFKKVKDQKGNEIYRLDKLSQKDSNHSYIYQKKGKEAIKKRQNQLNHQRLAVNKEVHEINRNQFAHNNPNHSYPYKNQQSYNNSYIYPFKNSTENQKQYLQKINNFHPSLYNYYNSQNNSYSPFINPFYQQHLNHAHHQELTTKRLFQEYISMACQKKIEQISKIKNSLYDLMIFIDKNYEVINDPRAKAKENLFSYCDEFQPKFLAVLMKQYIEHLKSKLQEEKLEEEQKTEKLFELKHVQKFVNWLKEMNMVQVLPEPIIIDEKESLLFKKQAVEEAYESEGFFSKKEVRE